ncbi:hypothetical protein QA811_17595 [Streptomyces sp. B21-102]|uniref:hypothetical protein n=1 Tax=Streptomyces sp. B21-102 TaxID=3039416 RepID=UPI002FF18618
MPRQIAQLPPDATSLARRVQALEREVTELRAARRMSAATVGTMRLYSADGQTLLAELSPEDGAGGGGLWTRGLQSPIPMAAYLNSGQLRWRPVTDGMVQVPASAYYDTDAFQYSNLTLTSGAVASTDHRALLILESLYAGQIPYVYVQGENGTQCNLDVLGVLTASSIAFGSVSITPSAANTPTSATVTGLALKGSTFTAVASSTSTVPGTQVTGVSTSSVTASGLTLWVTRTNTTATVINWMVMGI